MPNSKDIEIKFWKALEHDKIMMLGLVGVDETHTRPMTAQIQDSTGPIWFFGSHDSDLVRNMKRTSAAVATFVSGNQNLYATIHGLISMERDHEKIDQLWNPQIAAWYAQGKDDPGLALLRFVPNRAQVWLDGSSLLAGIKMMLGGDPKVTYQDNVATLNFREKQE